MAERKRTPWRWGGLMPTGDLGRGLPTFAGEMEAFHREMDRLFGDFAHGFAGPSLFRANGNSTLMPHVDETEDEKAYHVAVELPGIDEDDIEVTLSDGVLTVRGEKREEEEDKEQNIFRQERHFGMFRRTLPVPEAVDDAKVKATFKKGVLRIDLPKTKQAIKKVNKIEVKAA